MISVCILYICIVLHCICGYLFGSPFSQSLFESFYMWCGSFYMWVFLYVGLSICGSLEGSTSDMSIQPCLCLYLCLCPLYISVCVYVSVCVFSFVPLSRV